MIVAASGKVSSAPALYFRPSHPAGENDLIFQGTGNTLWYYHAPMPPPGFAPAFTGSKISGPGTTFGG